MIPIQSEKIDYLLNAHVKSVKQYIEKPGTKYTICGINKEINMAYPGETIDSILRAKPEKIKALIDKYGTINSDYFKTYKNYYTSFSGTKRDKFTFNAYDLVNGLGIRICPYCNRNFIYSSRLRRTAELDHFYPKDKYHLFALSFFNLIPVCHTCNHIKSNDVSKYPINPYSQWFEKNVIKFEYSLKTSNFGSVESIDLNLKSIPSTSQSAVDDHLDLLHITDLYDGHKDIVCELMQKREIYCDSYIYELIKKYERRVFFNRDELLKLITGNYVTEDDLLRRPLSKLNMDISMQLGFI